MKKKIEKYAKRFVRHMFETYKNKLAAIVLLAIGIVSERLSGDGTFLVLTIIFDVPLFFAKENHFM